MVKMAEGMQTFFISLLIVESLLFILTPEGLKAAEVW